MLCLVAESWLTLRLHRKPTRLLCPWEFSRQEYWSGLPCPLPGDLPNPGIEPRSPTLQSDSFPSGHQRSPNIRLLLLLLLSLFSRVNSVQPHRLLCHPWDSPGKNIGVGCHFLLQCMKVKTESEVAQSCPTLSDSMDCSLPGSPKP